MTKPSIKGLWLGVATIVGTVGLLPTLPATAEEIEEVVVTGSYIKRDSFDSSSPLTIVDQAELQAEATPNLGEILSNQTFNYGSDFQTNTYAARGQGGVFTQANLRGLGPRATLQLIDGKRILTRNMNNSIPQVAIERIDIIKDGASALYGSDAVAGVVNLVTRKNFSGSEFSYFHTRDQDDDHHEDVFDFISGADTDDGHITVAASYRRRTELQQVERPEFLQPFGNGFERSGTGNPGDWIVPNRGANGLLDGTATRHVDPGCGVAASPGGNGSNVAGQQFNNLSGDPNGPVATATNCRFHFGQTWNYINPTENYNGWLNFQHQFSENLSNEIDVIFTKQSADSRGSPQNPGGRTEEFPIVPGDHPGNPFRAFFDADGDGVIDAGEELYALDADGDFIPDRGTQDLNGDGLNDVLLAADPFDATQGIPFNEDVDVAALRIFGMIGLLDGANQPTLLNGDGSNTGNSSYVQTNFRVTNTLTYQIPDSSWEVQAILNYNQGEIIFEQKNTSQAALIQGLAGQLKANPTDATTSYWNPFSTQALQCVNRICQHTGTADYVNTVGVLDAINIQDHDVTDSELFTIDIIATGEIYELPAGMVAGAFGIQYRDLSTEVDLNAAYNQCDWHEGGCQFDYEAEQDVEAAFFELAIPVLDNLEVTAAGRYSDYGGSIGDSFDYKLAGLFQPYDNLSFRASFSTAFIAPDLEQLFEPEDCGLQTADDLVAGDREQTFRVACISGNANLEPEEAEVWNVGVSVDLLEGDLSIGLDFTSFSFEDRVADTSMNQVLSLDYANFLAAGFTAGTFSADGTTGDALNWANDPRSDPGILRDPGTGLITRVRTGRINAQEMEVSSWDLYLRYSIPWDEYGDFSVGMEATKAVEYDYDLGFGITGQGVGEQNESVIEVPPIPEYRATFNVNWFMGGHRANVRARYIDGFNMGFNSAGLQAGQSAINGTLKFDSIVYTDLTYAYTFDDLIGDRSTTIELGGRNIFDEFPDPVFNLGGIETFVHDIRGRMYYLRINQDL